MIRRPPRATRTDTLFPTRRSSDLQAAVLHHTHPVREVEDVMQVVADEEDADTLLLQMVNQLGNHGGLLRPERRGRLVHDEDFGVEQDGAGDGDRLALTAREVLHRVLDVLEVRVERCSTARASCSMASSSSSP